MRDTSTLVRLSGSHRDTLLQLARGRALTNGAASAQPQQWLFRKSIYVCSSNDANIIPVCQPTPPFSRIVYSIVEERERVWFDGVDFVPAYCLLGAAAPGA